MCFSEMLVNFGQTTQYHITINGNLDTNEGA